MITNAEGLLSRSAHTRQCFRPSVAWGVPHFQPFLSHSARAKASAWSKEIKGCGIPRIIRINRNTIRSSVSWPCISGFKNSPTNQNHLTPSLNKYTGWWKHYLPEPTKPRHLISRLFQVINSNTATPPPRPLAVAKLAVTGLLLCLVSTEELKMVCPVSKGFYPWLGLARTVGVQNNR